MKDETPMADFTTGCNRTTFSGSFLRGTEARRGKGNAETGDFNHERHEKREKGRGLLNANGCNQVLGSGLQESRNPLSLGGSGATRAETGNFNREISEICEKSRGF